MNRKRALAHASVNYGVVSGQSSQVVAVVAVLILLLFAFYVVALKYFI